MTDKMELSICKQLVVRQLDVLETITKNLKEINRVAQMKLDTFELEKSIVKLQEDVEDKNEEQEHILDKALALRLKVYLVQAIMIPTLSENERVEKMIKFIDKITIKKENKK